MLRAHQLHPLLGRHRSRAASGASSGTGRRTARVFDTGRPIALRCDPALDAERDRDDPRNGTRGNGRSNGKHGNGNGSGSRAVSQSQSARSGYSSPASFTAYVRQAMALDPALRGFEVEAFALPAAPRAVPAGGGSQGARAMHAGHAHAVRPEVITPGSPAAAPRSPIVQPPPASAVALPAARRSLARSQPQTPQTPQEALREHWAAGDARAEVAPRSVATSQEQAAIDAIREMHARPPMSHQHALPAALPPPASGAAAAPEPERVMTPRPEHPHDVFDRMASSLAYANTFDAGPVRLQRRFDQMNALLDHEQHRATMQQERAEAAAVSQSVVDDMSLMQDLVALRDRLALQPTDPVQEPPDALPPEATAAAAVPAAPDEAPVAVPEQSLQQDLAAIRAILGNPAEELTEPPEALPGPSEAAAVAAADATT